MDIAFFLDCLAKVLGAASLALLAYGTYLVLRYGESVGFASRRIDAPACADPHAVPHEGTRLNQQPQGGGMRLSLTRTSRIFALSVFSTLAAAGSAILAHTVKAETASATAAPGTQVQALGAPRAPSSIDENADSTFIREAYSDGGYWEWQERQQVNRGIGGR